MLCWLLTNGSRDGEVGDGGPENGHECSPGDGYSRVLWEGIVLSGSLGHSFGPLSVGGSRGGQQTLSLDPQNLFSPGRRGPMTEDPQDGHHPVTLWSRAETDEDVKPHRLHSPPSRDPWQGSLWVRGERGDLCLAPHLRLIREQGQQPAIAGN